MAIEPTVLEASGDETDRSAYTTGSISPASRALILLWVGNQVNAGSPNAPTITGCGLTWVQVGTLTSSSAPQLRGSLFRAMGTAPTTGALTIDLAAQTQIRCEWCIVQLTGVDTSGTDGSGAIATYIGGEGATGTTVTINLAASSSGNAVFAGLVQPGQGAITQGAGYTELSDLVIPGAITMRLQVEYRLTYATAVTWTKPGGLQWIGHAVGVVPQPIVPATIGSVTTLFAGLSYLIKVTAGNNFTLFTANFTTGVVSSDYLPAAATNALTARLQAIFTALGSLKSGLVPDAFGGLMRGMIGVRQAEGGSLIATPAHLFVDIPHSMVPPFNPMRRSVYGAGGQYSGFGTSGAGGGLDGLTGGGGGGYGGASNGGGDDLLSFTYDSSTGVLTATVYNF